MIFFPSDIGVSLMAYFHGLPCVCSYGGDYDDDGDNGHDDDDAIDELDELVHHGAD